MNSRSLGLRWGEGGGWLVGWCVCVCVCVCVSVCVCVWSFCLVLVWWQL